MIPAKQMWESLQRYRRRDNNSFNKGGSVPAESVQVYENERWFPGVILLSHMPDPFTQLRTLHDPPGLGYVPAVTDHVQHWQVIYGRSNDFEEVTPELGLEWEWSVEDPSVVHNKKVRPDEVLHGWEYAFDFWRFDLPRRKVHLRPHKHCFVRRRKWVVVPAGHASSITHLIGGIEAVLNRADNMDAGKDLGVPEADTNQGLEGELVRADEQRVRCLCARLHSSN